MFDIFLSHIPEGEPQLKIGPLLLWVSGYTYINQKGQGDFAYMRTPTILLTDNIVALSEMSETPIFTFKEFLRDIVNMYKNITVKRTIEFASHDSEFSLKLTNDLGQIKIDIKYHSWLHNGSLEFEDNIDQSYLPKIINDIKSILAKDY